MRIEINSGGLSSGTAFLDFQSDFDHLIDRSKKIVSSFQTIKSFANNMNGGIGNLQNAVEQIESKRNTEEAKVNALNGIKNKANSFVEMTRQVDLNVCGLVNRNKHEFYELNPWAKPPPPPEEEQKNYLQEGWDWLCGKAEEIKEGIKEGINCVKDVAISLGKEAIKLANWAIETRAKIENSIKEFCNSSIGKIVISVVIVAGLIALSVLTGGAAAVIFTMGAVGATAGLAVGTAKGIHEYNMNKKEGKEADLLDSLANNMAKETIKGAASGLADGIGLVGGLPARIAAGEILQVGGDALNNMWIDGMSSGEAWKEAAVSGTVSNGVDSLTFGIFHSKDIAKNAVTVPKNQILQYTKKGVPDVMKKDAYSYWAGKQIKEAWKGLVIPEINLKSARGIINTANSTLETVWSRFPSSVITGHDSIQDALSDGITDMIPAY